MGHRGISITLWVAAFVVTVLLAVFQRATGPSYPLRGTVTLAGSEEIAFSLPRSNQGRETLAIRVPDTQSAEAMTLEWRRYPTDEDFRTLAMTPDDEGRLVAEIPNQPDAGKVEYFIQIHRGEQVVQLPEAETVVARFRASVPAGVLIPHILAMFLSMLVSTRALFEVIRDHRVGKQVFGRAYRMIAEGVIDGGFPVLHLIIAAPQPHQSHQLGALTAVHIAETALYLTEAVIVAMIRQDLECPIIRWTGWGVRDDDLLLGLELPCLGDKKTDGFKANMHQHQVPSRDGRVADECNVSADCVYRPVQ